VQADQPRVAERRQAADQLDVGRITGLPSDSTGTDTFERFLWQAKIAVRDWLSTLAPGGPTALICEYVEDLAVVEANTVRFAQLKTRDRGSWTAARICAPGHAIEGLVKSFEVAKVAGILGIARFEVWLEGPQGTDSDTTKFFARPANAPEKVKARIRKLGIQGRSLTQFLGLLTINGQQPSRLSVDAEVMKAIGAVWPHLTFVDIEVLYSRLLSAATAAQSNSAKPAAVRLAIASAGPATDLSVTWGALAGQVLTREHLKALCPPVRSTTNAELFDRAAKGEATLLELKLRRAGASETTVSRAKLARAAMDAELGRLRAAGLVDQDAVDGLDNDLLDHALSVAAMADVSGAGPASRPGEYIYNNMASNGSTLAALDQGGLLKQNGRLLLGRICAVSDECRFGWGVV
jgi:hypothetical protein